MSDPRQDRGGESGLASVLLPPVGHEPGAAVLIVDLSRRLVTYANDLARELAPDRDLPMSVDEWSEAAGLEDVSGSDLPAGPNAAVARGNPAESLLRVARGRPVTGEAVTAARGTALTPAREVLWVFGLPLSGAPDLVSSLALVIFLPVRNARLISGVQESAVTLRDRAVLATRMSFTITDPTLPDNPLVWVNPAFTATTGYDFESVVGHNCRFLQGPGTDWRVVADIGDSVRAGLPITTTLLNYRKDGSAFWNEVAISPVRDRTGEVTHFVGVQADVTTRVEAERARDDALAQVEQSAGRLALMADFTARMAMIRQPEQIITLTATTLVPRVGTWCAIYSFDDSGQLTRPFLLHERQGAELEVRARLDRLRELVAHQLPTSGPIWRVLRGDDGEVLVSDFAAAPSEVTGAEGDERSALIRQLGARSQIVVPLRARTGILGCIAVMTGAERPVLDDDDLALVRDLAARAGLMLENTQLFAREQATAATLQRSLLPRLPLIEGIEIAAAYVPAADEAAVGGDWYDVFALGGTDGGVGVVVGDVMGHNYDSAARMGKLSTIVRAYAWPGSNPYSVLTAVDELLAGSGLDVLATCLYGRLTLHDGGATLRYSSAGHPPAIVRMPDGRARTLDRGRGPMFGVSRLMRAGATRPTDACVELPRGSVLICFTDGLIDAFCDEPDIDAGLVELRRRTEALRLGASTHDIVDALTGAAVRHADDVAVVAIKIC